MEVIIFVVIAVVVIVIVIIFVISQEQKINSLRTELENEFPEAKIHVSHNDSSFLVVDFRKEKMVVGLQKARGTILAQEQPYRSEIPFSGIVKAEVLKDDTQVASTNRGSQALGAAVGAVAFGGVGAIIGGLSGSSTSSSATKRLSIQITVDDPQEPLHEVTFYETERKEGGKRGEMFFDQGAQQVAEFAAHIEAAVRKADGAKPNSAFPPTASKGNTSVTEQIGELWSLKEAGALTQEEFETQKAKLING
ncbi:SHOCT domain-containing protein [Tateyamaria sp. Alg231-49]|uniref:SHOCT domain-containing protein n=1 Tax=Tateyamaria sp. Alg231-49 TaxID=1922219 RepID=UPI000D55CA66|nr:SHOCT domain-containing protein [Tateyamaria sp. Alg231-49]